MDYQEARRLLHPDTTRDAIWEIADKQEAIKKINEACVIACDAIDELQEYKQIGTLEDLKKLKERELSGVELAKIACNLNLLEKYKQLGTPEEIREAVEKQKAKKPKGDLHSVPHYRCPNCNRTVNLYQNSEKYEICRWCGQHIDWSEVEERAIKRYW